jgi:hypothetical protein
MPWRLPKIGDSCKDFANLFLSHSKSAFTHQNPLIPYFKLSHLSLITRQVLNEAPATEIHQICAQVSGTCFSSRTRKWMRAVKLSRRCYSS